MWLYHPFIVLKGTITVVGEGANAAALAADRNYEELKVSTERVQHSLRSEIVTKLAR